ncbi:oligoendopeptidase F [bacterium]|nr:oligoendopeptidase F [bacterium]
MLSLVNRKALCLSTVLMVLGLALPALAAGYTPDPTTPRADIPAAYQWHPTDIFPDDAAWEAEMAAVKADIPTLTGFKGHLAESADTMLQAEQALNDLGLRLYKLYIYAQLQYDVNQGDSDLRQMQGRVAAMMPAFGEATSWIEPELLTIDPDVIKGFMAESSDLAVFSYYFSELWRQKEHTLSEREERIMALTGNMRSVPSDAHEALLGVDMEFPEIVGPDGTKVPVTVSGFSGLRSNDNYLVRKQAADAFFGTLREFQNSFAVLLDGVVKSHIMTKTARGYDSCLDASMSPDNISPDAYRMLVETVRKNLPQTMHKYVELRRKVMGLDGKLAFPNLYNPMIEGVEPAYTYDEGRKMIVDALQPLGKEYVTALATGLDPASGWIDIYPNQDKRSGAYSNGALARDIHPFVLHNFDNTLDAVSTTAHEMGHAMHSWFSSKNQPPIYADYTTFLAEIASTCNEALLTNYMLKKYDNDIDMKLMLLNQRLESIRLTIFRQTLFADFELQFHEYAEEGNSLTADYLNGLYAGLIKEYYGPDFAMGPDDECEWMFIPHFYYNFYVFTYATGLTSGLALADEITAHGDKAARRYIDNMLKAGSSAPPLDILRNAGVDLETPAPIQSAMDVFARTVDEFDKLWTKKSGHK